MSLNIRCCSFVVIAIAVHICVPCLLASEQDGSAKKVGQIAVTVPNNKRPSDAPHDPNWPCHGSDKLMAAIGPTGKWVCHALKRPSGPLPAGWLHKKCGWFRGIPGELVVEGRRLDGSAPPLKARLPRGYGAKGFQPVGFGFPTEGYWEITGRVGEESVTFVVHIVRNKD